MNNPFLEYLESLDDIPFIMPTENDIEKLKQLSSCKLPAMFLEAYSRAVPADDIEYADFVYYGIDRIVDENTNYVPGANILPLGLFTFSSTLDGDSICFDINNPNYPVYQCSHSLLSDENEISYYKDEMHNLPFNYENVVKVSPKLADSFDEFVAKLQSDEIEIFSVSEIISRPLRKLINCQ
ncbi:MAG: SMI1/KNR4 family protein [Firmicutes bacterium]|nr:SMI1/KNR4 family protein [Bacillota bacterium]